MSFVLFEFFAARFLPSDNISERRQATAQRN